MGELRWLVQSERSAACTHGLGQDFPINADLVRFIRYLSYGKQEEFNLLMLLVCRNLAFCLRTVMSLTLPKLTHPFNFFY